MGIRARTRSHQLYLAAPGNLCGHKDIRDYEIDPGEAVGLAAADHATRWHYPADPATLHFDHARRRLPSWRSHRSRVALPLWPTPPSHPLASLRDVATAGAATEPVDHASRWHFLGVAATQPVDPANRRHSPVAVAIAAVDPASHWHYHAAAEIESAAPATHWHCPVALEG